MKNIESKIISNCLKAYYRSFENETPVYELKPTIFRILAFVVILTNCFSLHSSGKKRASIIHQFIDGTIIPLDIDSPISVPVDNMLDSLTLNHPVELKIGEESLTSACGSDIRISKSCFHCGK